MLLLVAVFCSACGAASEVYTAFRESIPTVENTYTEITDLNRDMLEAIERGDADITFNIADTDEDALEHLGDMMSTFWGRPDTYTVNHTFEAIEDIVDGRATDVRNVTATFKHSNNYYAYRAITAGEAIPEDMPHAQAVADALPTVWREIEAGLPAGAGDYETALAVHDWLVANLTYDDGVGDLTDANGSYGALIDRRSMCRGYAETFCLLLKCYSDIDAYEIVGDARQDADGDWVGHAWNLVRIDGQWMQIDATFDDPEDNPDGVVLHFYFGQDDALMHANHRWEESFYPEAAGEGFYYFRREGLFAEDEDGFREIAERVLAEGDPTFFQVAVRAFTLDEENSQFLFDIGTEKKMLELYWSEQVYEDVHVLTIEPKYEDLAA
jgi:hypothetical protein